LPTWSICVASCCNASTSGIERPVGCNAEIKTLITMIHEVGNLLFGAAERIEDAIRDVARTVKLLSIREVPK
jgi:hypothetical protein